MLAKQEDYANALKLFESSSQADPEFILPKQNFAAVTELMQGEAAEELKNNIKEKELLYAAISRMG